MTAPTPEAVAELCARLYGDDAFNEAPYKTRSEAAAMLESLSRALAERDAEVRRLGIDRAVANREAQSCSTLAENAMDRAERAEAELAAARKVLALAKDELGDWDYEPREQHNHWCSRCDSSIDGNRTIRDAIAALDAAQAHGERRALDAE